MPFHIKPKKAITDDELLEKFKKHGDLDVLGQLYERYMHLVYGVCLKYFKDREQAQDGVMEIFEKLIKELPDKVIINFKPWLYVVTKNHCLMAIRHQKSIQTQMHKIQIDQSVFMENGFDWHPFENNGQENMEDLLQICLDKLKNQQKLCVEQFYLEKKCYKEISDNLNLDVKKVKSFIQNGKRNLKICLDGAHEK